MSRSAATWATWVLISMLKAGGLVHLFQIELVSEPLYS